MSRSSVFEWACVPAAPADASYASMNARTLTSILHILYPVLLRLHKTLLFFISPHSASSWCHLHARSYIGGSDILEVIEKLSCRSGWFVKPVHALIHPATSPHKKDIKQEIPEERRQRWGQWKKGEAEKVKDIKREREREHGQGRCFNSKEKQGQKRQTGRTDRRELREKKFDTSGLSSENITIPVSATIRSDICARKDCFCGFSFFLFFHHFQPRCHG